MNGQQRHDASQSDKRRSKPASGLSTADRPNERATGTDGTVTDVSERSANVWDEAASTFDQAADHGLHDPDVRSAWTALLSRTLPQKPSRVADLGCGTGSLTTLAADLGHTVDGIDFSEAMLTLARTKSAGRQRITFTQGDAANPPLPDNAYDVVMCRHVLWALPHAVTALSTWSRLLRPTGLLVLIEGRWSTGAGLSSHETAALLRTCGFTPKIEPLDDPQYWGGPTTDDRYLATGRKGHFSRDRDAIRRGAA
ncbi:MAG: methyltransferase domain-containing protein [Propionibacteriaceae bacterium]